MKEIYPADFPSYDTLVSLDKSNKKAARTVAFRATFDTFKVTCILLAMGGFALFGLDVLNLLQLSIKQLALAGISSALLVLPFAAKFKMLGIEFERHNQHGSIGSEP